MTVMNSAAVKQVSVFVADQVSKQDVQASSTQFFLTVTVELKRVFLS